MLDSLRSLDDRKLQSDHCFYDDSINDDVTVHFYSHDGSDTDLDNCHLYRHNWNACFDRQFSIHVRSHNTYARIYVHIHGHDDD